MPKKDHTDILNEFLSYPLGSADGIMERFASLPGAVMRGAEPFRYVYVPGKRQDKVLLAAHADTVWYEGSVLNEIFTRPGIGADDRAGCAILWLLKDSGHSLLVLDGEERDLNGAIYVAEDREMLEMINRDHNLMVEFDHSGGSGLQFYDISTKEYREYVTLMLPGFVEEKSHSATDICALCKDICGVNISTGYANAHLPTETVDVKQWQNTLYHARSWLTGKDIPRFALVKEPEDPEVIAERMRKDAEVQEILTSLNID